MDLCCSCPNSHHVGRETILLIPAEKFTRAISFGPLEPIVHAKLFFTEIRWMTAFHYAFDQLHVKSC